MGFVYLVSNRNDQIILRVIHRSVLAQYIFEFILYLHFLKRNIYHTICISGHNNISIYNCMHLQM